MSARALWKAVVVLGKKRVPVALYSAVVDRSIRLHLLHDQDLVPVKHRFAEVGTGRTVPADTTRRGIEVEPGRVVVLDDAELAQLDPEPSREIEVVSCVPRDGIDSRWFERPYYLGPERGHAREYFALAAALAAAERDGFARWTMRKREYAGALRLHDGYLALITLRHAGEVIAASRLQAPEGRELDRRELDLARQLVGALGGPFEHAAFRDEYRERLADLVQQKQKGKRTRLTRWRGKPVRDDSLVSALERSLKTAG